MACGTPVVACRRGSVPELVVDGVTGFVCSDPAELADAVAATPRLEPADCRAHVQAHFDVPAMVSGYERAYRRVLDEITEPSVPRVGVSLVHGGAHHTDDVGRR
jgi:glycosyltransferase involved in cell wall biosynthesis